MLDVGDLIKQTVNFELIPLKEEFVISQNKQGRTLSSSASTIRYPLLSWRDQGEMQGEIVVRQLPAISIYGYLIWFKRYRRYWRD